MKNYEIAKTIEHTLLKPEATTDDIKKLCLEAVDWNFYSVCIHSCRIKQAKDFLKGSPVKIVSVAGFPLGASSTVIKCHEVDDALTKGADEVDVVMNIGWMKERALKAIQEEFTQIVKTANTHPVKIIIETCLLSEEEKTLACHMAVAAGAAFVKTSTGFSKGGATVEDVKLLKSLIAGKVQVKASGGIRDIQTAMLMLAAGALRLGTSSGVAIMQNAGKEEIEEIY